MNCAFMKGQQPPVVEWTLRREVYLKELSCKRKAQIYRVFFVLRDAQIASRDCQRAVIKYFHDNRRRSAVFPCVVAKGLTERMAGHTVLKRQRISGAANEAVGLNTADSLLCFGVFNKKMFFLSSFGGK